MRKFNKFAYASAMLLAGGMVLASCSSDDELTNANPTYDGESVKAQFAISVPGYAVNGSRMTAGEAQETGVFNGIENLQLFPLKLAVAGDTVADGSTVLGYSPIWLGEINSDAEFLANTNTPSWNPATQANVKRYTDLKLGLGINAFLVYGKAKHVAGSSDAEDQLIASYDVSALTTASTANDINFSLVPRYTAAAAEETATLTALNEITTELLAISSTDYDLLKENVKKMMAGSSASVLAMVEDLWNSSARLDNSRGTTPTDGAGYALRTKIKNYFSVTENTLGENDELSWNTNPDFPKVANLPDGAVAVKFNTGTNLFEYSASITLDGPIDVPARDNYVLPAQLYYRSNTPIGVKDATVFDTPSNYTGMPWNTVFTNNYGTAGSVAATTRSVVLQKELQYAVADMATQVKVSTATIKDSKGNIVSIPAGGLKVTGILVGDQKNVDFKFQPKGSTAYTLYDNTIQDNGGNDCMAKVSATTYSNPNHTLVLETAAAARVRVAVEFQNTGSDFYGYQKQLIPAGGKFYLIAELDPAATGATAPGEYTTLNQVFKQDFTTVVKLNITSLKNAYNVIPDLRAPQLEFGMSVDLKWQTGMNFEVDFN
ncbi:MAG: hypothetical protein ACI4UC_01765 [Alloprevotella sp.]